MIKWCVSLGTATSIPTKQEMSAHSRKRLHYVLVKWLIWKFLLDFIQQMRIEILKKAVNRRDVSPQFYQANPATIHRIANWLKREVCLKITDISINLEAHSSLIWLSCLKSNNFHLICFVKIRLAVQSISKKRK